MDKRYHALQDWVSTVSQRSIDRIEPASADASFRRYFRIWQGDDVLIVMDAPPDKENCQAFFDITQSLHATGIHVPEVFHVDLQQGFMLLSDLGEQNYLDKLNEDNAGALYQAALKSLARIQTQAGVDALPVYDAAMLRTEISLFTDWLLQQYLHIPLHEEETQALQKVFNQLVDAALKQPQVFVHRDYHSRNLMFVDDTSAYKNPGIIDYQDAVKGPVTYDLVSLLKDCYVQWPRASVLSWLQDYYQQYIESSYTQYQNFSEFLHDFDLMGVQRHLKASGIFCRLYLRDGKSGYLNDVPRTLSYISALKKDYPQLTPLVDLIDNKVLPAWPK